MDAGQGQNAPATRADLTHLLEEFRKDFATKSDLERFATKADLERFATKADLERFATKADLERFATKSDLERCAMKADLERFATKEDMLGIRDELKNDIAGVWSEVSDLRRHVSSEDERTRVEIRLWRAESSRRMRRLESRSR